MSDGKYQERYDVVVVGGGFAGRIAARVAAEGGAKVLLVDSKEYFEFTPAACRCIVHPPSIHHCTSRHNSPPGLDMRVMHGTVRELRRNDVLVVFPEGKRRVRFRYCVWAGGCSYKSPIRPALDSESVDERRAELERNRIQLEQARRILVVGGGLVGVELAAELVERVKTSNRMHSASTFNDKPEVVLATSSSALMPRLPRRAGQYAESFLRKRGVKVVVGRFHPVPRVGRSCGKPLVYQSEKDPEARIAADIAFDCSGPRPSALGEPLRNFVSAAGASSDINPRSGVVRVQQTLQLRCSDNIFVSGDAGIVDNELTLSSEGGLNCEKTGFAAGEAGGLAARNVLRLMDAGSENAAGPASLLRYPEDAFAGGAFPRLFIVSLGKWDGVVCIGPLVFGGVLAALAKVFVEKLSIRAYALHGLSSKILGAVEVLSFRFCTFLSNRANRRIPHRRGMSPATS